MKPHSEEWEKLADQLARDMVSIYPCKKCGYPVIYGYYCDHCRNHNPTQLAKEDAKNTKESRP
jgi:hypothetical protein